MKRFLSHLAFALAVLAFPAFISAQTPPPAPFGQQALTKQLGGILFGARQDPSMALTHDQAQELLPLLQQWQANPQLDATEAQKIWNQAQTYLTPGQKAFNPSFGGRQESRNQTLTQDQRNARTLDRLIARLQNL